MSYCYVDNGFYVDEAYSYSRARPPTVDVYYTQNRVVYQNYKSANKNVRYLSEVTMNWNGFHNLYELYNYFFNDSCTDGEMAIRLMKALLPISNQTIFCIEIDRTFCWFTIKDNMVKVLGSKNFSSPLTIHSCGVFYKELRLAITLSGGNLVNTVYYSYGRNGILWDYVDYHDLMGVFNRVHGLCGYDLVGLISRLGKYRKYADCSASSFVSALSDSSKVLKLHEGGKALITRNVFYKDYSICRDSIDGGSYGIILDCEGVKGSNGSLQNGSSQVGGIVYGLNKGILVNLYQFVADEELIEDTFLQVLDVYRSITNHKEVINTYVFGKSDRVMMKYTVDKFSKRGKKFMESRFNIQDCIPMINADPRMRDYTGKKSLSNLASHFGVFCVTPKHNALADARTLFNVLAEVEWYKYKGGY